ARLEERELAEELAGAEDGQEVLPAVVRAVPELDLPLEDQVEPVAGAALVEEGLPAPQADLLHGLPQGSPGVVVEGSEERHGADRGVVHGGILFTSGSAARARGPITPILPPSAPNCP